MVTLLAEKMPSLEEVSQATYQTAFHDHLLSLPVGNTLQAIRDLGLERFLPTYVDFERGRVADSEVFHSVVQLACHDEYLAPQAFVERLEREHQEGLSVSGDPLKDLNYRLVGEVLSLSPSGEVTSLVYKIACARVLERVGIDVYSKMCSQCCQGTTDESKRTFGALVQVQVVSEYQRFIRELPIMEHVLQQEGGQLPEDISKMDVAIFTMYRDDGKPIPLRGSLIP